MGAPRGEKTRPPRQTPAPPRAAASADALRHWLALIRAPGIGPGTGARLLEQFGNPAAIFGAGPAGWRKAGVPDGLFAGLREPDAAGVDRDLQWLAGAGRALITREDPRYPPQLAEITHAPLALFAQGACQWLAAPQLAIVGARAATPQGLDNARAFAAELAKCGMTITSGLALGIDGAAHEGALDGAGATVAVCGTGLDRVYPARHRALAHRIAAQGVLISEFPPGVPAIAENFPRRNRIISGLALGVLVVEAARNSGSLITARLALEQGREVFAIPGSIHNPMARGCHWLIRQGAKLVETAADILEELPPLPGITPPPAAVGTPAAALPADHVRVLEAIGFEPTAFDRLLERVALPLARLSEILLTLELEGRIAAVPGGAFMRRDKIP